MEFPGHAFLTSFRGFFCCGDDRAPTYRGLAVLALIAAAAAPTSASATVLSGRYEFTATGFPADAPFSSVWGSFAFRGYEPGARYLNNSTVITEFSINIPLGPGQTILLTSEPDTSLGDQVFIGSSIDGARSVRYGSGDFVMLLLNFDTTPIFAELLYAPIGPVIPNTYRPLEKTLTGYTVPEPPMLALLGWMLPALLWVRAKKARG